MTQVTFKNQAEAIAALGPLYKAGRIGQYTPVTSFGRTTVKVWFCGSWKPLTEALFSALVSA